MRLILSLLSFAIFTFSCQDSQKATTEASLVETPAETTTITDSATWLIQEAIQSQGGGVLDSAQVQFVFRDRVYVAKRKDARFSYFRRFLSDAGNRVEDVLTNDGLSRSINGEPVVLSPRDSGAYARSVNSVIYFALIPYFLQDSAVQSEYLGVVDFANEQYHKLKIGFAEYGGGRDFDDEYIYWFRQSDFRLDYLAYNFQIDGGGARFRKAYNQRRINGVHFVDYLNMKPATDFREVAVFDSLYEAGGLDSLSLIVLEEVEVSY